MIREELAKHTKDLAEGIVTFDNANIALVNSLLGDLLIPLTEEGLAEAGIEDPSRALIRNVETLAKIGVEKKHGIPAMILFFFAIADDQAKYAPGLEITGSIKDNPMNREERLELAKTLFANLLTNWPREAEEEVLMDIITLIPESVDNEEIRGFCTQTTIEFAGNEFGGKGLN